LIVDKKTINTIASNKDSLKKTRSDLSDTAKAPADQQDRVTKEKRAPLVVLKEYAAWAHLFEEDLTIEALPKHKP
jgi:hypothetical protein